MKKYILVVIFGLHCAPWGRQLYRFSDRAKFRGSLGLRRFSFYKKELYIFATARAKFGFVFQRRRYPFWKTWALDISYTRTRKRNIQAKHSSLRLGIFSFCSAGGVCLFFVFALRRYLRRARKTSKFKLNFTNRIRVKFTSNSRRKAVPLPSNLSLLA